MSNQLKGINEDPVDHNKAREILERSWKDIEALSSEELKQRNFIEEENLRQAIRRLVSSETKSFRYAVVTQILAKATEPSINCLCLQVKARIKGSFDARSLARYVVFPFDVKMLKGILGASEDPYVSKPLRHDMIDLSYEREIRDKHGWEDLYFLLSEVERRNDQGFTLNILKQVLLECQHLIYKYIKVPVPSIPERLTFQQVMELIEGFLFEPSGGIRLQVVIYSLLKVFSNMYKLFDYVETERITVANVYAKRMADIQCFSHDKKLVLAIAVTERLSFTKLQDELRKAKDRGIKNFIIVASKVDVKNDVVKNLLREYSAYLDAYITHLMPFIKFFILLLSEEAKRKFLEEVDTTLRKFAYYEHRARWLEILKGLN